MRFDWDTVLKILGDDYNLAEGGYAPRIIHDDAPICYVHFDEPPRLEVILSVKWRSKLADRDWIPGDDLDDVAMPLLDQTLCPIYERQGFDVGYETESSCHRISQDVLPMAEMSIEFEPESVEDVVRAIRFCENTPSVIWIE